MVAGGKTIGFDDNDDNSGGGSKQRRCEGVERSYRKAGTNYDH